MADLHEDTTLTLIQLLYTKTILKQTEYRTAPKPFLMQAIAAAPRLDEEFLIKLREADKQPISANYLKLPTSTSGTARETFHTGPGTASIKEDFTFSRKTEKLSWTEQQFDSNLIDGKETFALQIATAVDKLMGRFNTEGITTWLPANKSTVNLNDNSLGIWNDTNDVFEIAAADKTRAPYAATNNMFQNNYTPTYNVIADNPTYASYQELMAQKECNSANNGWQQFDEFNMAIANGLVPGGTYKGISYWFIKDSVGFYTWIPQGNRRGDGESVKSHDGKLGVLTDPRYPGIEFALSGYTRRVDDSANGGTIQSYKTEIEISLDGVLRKAAISTAGETVIHAVAQL